MYFPETARFDRQTPPSDPDWEDDYVWRTPAGQLLSPRDFQAQRDLPLQRVCPVKLFCTLPILFILFILYKLWWNQGYWWRGSGSLSPSTNFKIYNHSLIICTFSQNGRIKRGFAHWHTMNIIPCSINSFMVLRFSCWCEIMQSLWTRDNRIHMHILHITIPGLLDSSGGGPAWSHDQAGRYLARRTKWLNLAFDSLTLINARCKV